MPRGRPSQRSKKLGSAVRSPSLFRLAQEMPLSLFLGRRTKHSTAVVNSQPRFQDMGRADWPAIAGPAVEIVARFPMPGHSADLERARRFAHDEAELDEAMELARWIVRRNLPLIRAALAMANGGELSGEEIAEL